MTYNPDDPIIMPERKRHVAHVNYRPWIISAGAIAALVFLMVFFMSGNHQDAASNGPRTSATPATSGSAVPAVPGAR